MTITVAIIRQNGLMLIIDKCHKLLKKSHGDWRSLVVFIFLDEHKAVLANNPCLSCVVKWHF